MNYPLSSPVSPGDATLADQYNRLRSDALRFGADENASVTIADMLRGYRSPLRLTLEGPALRLEASAAQPCAFLINGIPAEVRAPLTLTLSAAEFPNGGNLSIAARKTPSSPGFELTAKETSVPLGPDERKIAEITFNAAKNEIESFALADGDRVPRFSAETVPLAPCGRLTFVSGNPFPAFDVAQAATLYFTPYQGREIALFTPSQGWRMERFDELSLPLAGLNAAFCHDIFLTRTAAGAALRAEPWASLTNRNRPLIRQDGVLVLDGNPEFRYLGTLGLSEKGKSRDTASERNLWNLHGAAYRPLRKLCAPVQIAPSVINRWTAYARDETAAVSAVIGFGSAGFALSAVGSLQSISTGCALVGIGIDAPLDDPDMIVNSAELTAQAVSPGPLTAMMIGRDSARHLGKHTYAMIAYATGSGTVFNGNCHPQNQIGLSGGFFG